MRLKPAATITVSHAAAGEEITAVDAEEPGHRRAMLDSLIISTTRFAIPGRKPLSAYHRWDEGAMLLCVSLICSRALFHSNFAHRHATTRHAHLRRNLRAA